MKNALFVTLALTAAPVFAADFDYTADREFQIKYPDLACVDTGPLTREEAEAFTAAKLQEMGRKDKVEVKRGPCFGDAKNATADVEQTVSGSEYLDRLYARLSSGPIPHGFYNGKVIISRDRGIKSVAELGVWMPKEDKIEKIAERMWSGKYFDRDKMYLKNRINLDGVSWNSLPKNIEDKRMKFPAKLYCGQSLFDSRRESLVIDYKYGVEDRPAGVETDKAIDWLAGKKGLAVRDEVRMVRPGLLLGRAYMQGAFGLYFVLEYAPGTGKDPSWDEPDACWIGHQRQIKIGKKPSDYSPRGI